MGWRTENKCCADKLQEWQKIWLCFLNFIFILGRITKCLGLVVEFVLSCNLIYREEQEMNRRNQNTSFFLLYIVCLLIYAKSFLLWYASLYTVLSIIYCKRYNFQFLSFDMYRCQNILLISPCVIVKYIGELGIDFEVYRNDELTLDELKRYNCVWYNNMLIPCSVMLI